jgi:hypothetical protein
MSEPILDPDRLAATARDVLTARLPGWPRTAALLARMALERAATRAVAARHRSLDVSPGARSPSMRSILLLLRTVSTLQTVDTAQRAWAGLSRACHQHPYELAPTIAEVSALVDDVDAVLLSLAPERSAPTA